MTDFADGGYSDLTLIEIGGFTFAVKIDCCWHDGKPYSKSEFTDEMKKALEKHHSKTLKSRVNNIGE